MEGTVFSLELEDGVQAGNGGVVEHEGHGTRHATRRWVGGWVGGWVDEMKR